MVGYLYLAIALFAGLTKGYCGKKVGHLAKTLSDGVGITVLRMFFCTVFGGLLVLWRGLPAAPNLTAWLLFLLSAVCMSVFNVSWLFSVKNESYLFLSIATMFGSMAAAIASAVFFREAIRPAQWIGMLLLVLSVWIMHGYNQKLKGRMTAAQLITLIVCGLSSGLVDFTQKSYMKLVGESAEAFNLFTYALSFLFLAGFLLLLRGRSVPSPDSTPPRKNRSVLLYVLIMSLCLYLNSLFKTFAAGILPAAQIYPVLQGLNLILSSLMAQFLFKEKLNTSGSIGMLLALCAILCINF